MIGTTCVRAIRDFVVAVLVLLVLQVGVAQPFHVPTSSMEGTVLAGDRVIVDKITLGPRTPDWLGVPFTELGTSVPALKLPGLRHPAPGDIVVVRTPANAHVPYFKRIVAVGGDVLEVRDKRLYVNGTLRPDPAEARHEDPRLFRRGAVMDGIPSALGNRDNWGPLRVPDGTVFLMGDNRDHSFDSRWFGPVPESAIIGLARFVYFSWDEHGPRWERFGRPLART